MQKIYTFSKKAFWREIQGKAKKVERRNRSTRG
jgi:hypothetical protein